MKDGQQHTEYLLPQHRRIQDRARLRDRVFAAEFEVLKVHHERVGDGAFADGGGDGVGEDVCEVVGLDEAAVDAGGDQWVVEDGVGDGGCVGVVDGVEDGFEYGSFVWGVSESAGHGFLF